MNYLTNYYKNLSEQLQQRVNELNNLIEKLDPVGKREVIGKSKKKHRSYQDEKDEDLAREHELEQDRKMHRDHEG